MNIRSPRLNRGRSRLWAAIAFPLLALPVFAQEANSANDEPVKLDKFVVTGSYIPYAADAPAIPVTTITSEDIDNTAVSTNLLDVLRKTMPQFVGNGNLGVTNADIASGLTGGGSAISLRNAQTLVLINGRRAAYSPILGGGGIQFVDLNLIPLAAVDRVEVLQDGASAIYGTDAVSGVVNIILKTDFNGFEAGARYGWADGNYAERKFSLVGGVSNDKTSFTIGAEFTRTDPLFQFERPYSAETYGTPTFGGVILDLNTFDAYVLNPNLNAPPGGNLTLAQLVSNGTYIPVDFNNLILGLGNERQYAFNLARYVTLTTGQQRQTAFLNFEHQWLPAVQMFGDLLYTKTKSFSQLNAQPMSSAIIPANDPTNPSDMDLLALNRFTDYPRQYFYTSESLRAVIGLRGTIADRYNWEMAADRNEVSQSYQNPNVVNTAARIAAVDSGVVNMFARRQAPGAIDSAGMFGVAMGYAISRLENYDVRVTGTLAELPAGEIGFAVGAEYRKETLTQDSDVYSRADTFGWDSATTLEPLSADRNVWSSFVNVRVPIFGGENATTGFHLLELEGALRNEKYSDTDDPTVPKFTLRWLPFDDQFAVRATYAESFAAPNLFQLFGPSGIGSTPSLALNRLGGGTITGQAEYRNLPNRSLAPTESDSLTVGFVWSPKNVKGLSVTLDYFRIQQDGLVVFVGPSVILQDVENNGPASIYADRVRFGPPGVLSSFDNGTPVTAPGQIGSTPRNQTYVTDFPINASTTNLDGIDLKIGYQWSTESLGSFDFGLNVGYINSYTYVALPGQAETETAGLMTAFNGTIPEWQSIFTAQWNRGNWGATFAWQHIPEVTDTNAYDPADPTADAFVEAFNSVDLGVSYTFGSDSKWFKGLSVRFGANNVFDEMPPQAKGTFSNGNADLATYGAVGRLMFVEARYKF